MRRAWIGGAGAGIALACALGALTGCGRTRLAFEDAPAPGGKANVPSAGHSGAAGQGTAATGSKPPSTPVITDPPTMMQPATPMAGRDADPRRPPPGSGGRSGMNGRAGGPPGTGGWSGGSGRNGGTAGAPRLPDDFDPLNPQRCAVDEPTVLSIDPGGRSGSVTGWLESAPSLLFDANDLPRFGVGPSPGANAGDLQLWWSIASVEPDNEGGSFYFYAYAADTDLAVVRARGALEDASILAYETEVIGPVEIGQIVVSRQRSTGRYVAVRVVSLYGTEPERRSECAAIDARWQFADPGTARFSRLP
jgi:hypothetical protein